MMKLLYHNNKTKELSNHGNIEVCNLMTLFSSALIGLKTLGGVSLYHDKGCVMSLYPQGDL